MAPKLTNYGTDPYAALGLPRTFYLDPSVIEEAFRRAAALHHPDQPTGSTAAFQELQEAAAILRDPAKRLRHLAGAAEQKSFPLPAAAAELFPTIVATFQQTDALIKKYQAAPGNLAKALIMEELLEKKISLQNALQKIKIWSASLQQQLQKWDDLNLQPSSDLILELANQFTFSQRWLQQLRERELNLATLIK